jgi:hypothetical protein
MTWLQLFGFTVLYRLASKLLKIVQHFCESF